ncbi:uncharacterized protein EI97DRAFT_439789 [Westerdykella ornata]|uniref:Uncharacterized protein n=1 Tax=Westerdykella ornata TaxID=318751 RepID=A0A6A6JT74_WESOR|nr:uncharacterized protein EI97DRAFT_439789 [Westerdykella ornata]KAF2279444.1 hypothetical protein EI97DRAFT_439789 [Westerdykella ornata]
MSVDDAAKNDPEKHDDTGSDRDSPPSIDEDLADRARRKQASRSTSQTRLSNSSPQVKRNTGLLSPRLSPQRSASPNGSRKMTSPRPRPGRLGQECANFLRPREVTVQRDLPEPGRLSEEVRVPYMGPLSIDTSVFKRTPKCWGHRIAKSGKTCAQSEPGSPVKTSSSDGPNGQRKVRRKSERPASGQDFRSHWESPYGELDHPVTPMTPPSSDCGDGQSEGETSNSLDLMEPIYRNDSGVAEHPSAESFSDLVGSESDDATESTQQTEESLIHTRKPSQCHSMSEDSYARDLRLRPTSQASSMGHTDSILPLHMSPFDYAIAPYLQNVRSSGESYIRNLPSPTEPSTPSVNRSFVDDDDDSIAEFSHRNEQLYPHPDRDPYPDPQLELFLLNMSAAMRSRYINLRTVLSRCTMLASCRVDRSSKYSAPPITNFHLLSRLARRHALPIAKNLELEGFQALCHYWIGRGEAGLRNWDAAEAAFEEALKLQITTRTDFRPRAQGRDAQTWLVRIRKQISMVAIVDEDKSVTDVLERYDHYWEAVEEGDRVDVEASRDQIPTAWVPDELLDHGEFTAKDLAYVKHSSYENDEAVKGLEAVIAENQWKISQKKMDYWVSLWEETQCC